MSDPDCLHDNGFPGWACGTYGTYKNLGCSGVACRAANVKSNAVGRVRRNETLADDDPRHGRYTTYTNHACRCDACRAANAERDRIRRARRRGRQE